jgi:subtilisin family serine protease
MVIEGGNIIARILGGMDWAVAQGAKILNMSLGLRGYREEFLPLMQTLRARGLLPVIASGNEGAGTSRSPGNYDLCLSVGACDAGDAIPDFSSSQYFKRDVDPYVPDIVGPGADVLSAMPGKKFGVMEGTSMATPHIAGLAALLWEAKPNATVDEIETAILEACHRPDTMARPRANRGIPDAVAAHKALTGGVAPPATARPAAPRPKRKRPKKAKSAKKAKKPKKRKS